MRKIVTAVVMAAAVAAAVAAGMGSASASPGRPSAPVLVHSPAPVVPNPPSTRPGAPVRVPPTMAP